MSNVVTEDRTGQEVDRRSGQEMLISQVSEVTNQVEALAVKRIDDLINRLENLKQRIVLENRAAIDRTSRFISMVDSGIRDVDRLESLTSDLEKARAT